MPVTINPSSAKPQFVRPNNNMVTNAKDILSWENLGNRTLIDSSFGADGSFKIRPRLNGMVQACVEAYKLQLHLSLRPEDVWFTILTQLTAYLDKYVFHWGGMAVVVHDRRNELVVTYNHDSNFATKIANLSEFNIINPFERKWVTPTFSTTTENDKIVAWIIMMALPPGRSYIEYKSTCRGGVPSVTLEGEKSDWEELLTKIMYIDGFGEEPARFGELLKPILTYFVRSFENPSEPKVVTFWQEMFLPEQRNDLRNIDESFRGWLTAFCFWNGQGGLLYESPCWIPELDVDIEGYSGSKYCRLDYHNLPSGYSTVPIIINDNDRKIPAQLFAGSAGYLYSGSTNPAEHEQVRFDTIRPEVGWWAFFGAAPQETTTESQQNSSSTPSQAGSSDNNNNVMNSGSNAGTIGGTRSVLVNRRFVNNFKNSGSNAGTIGGTRSVIDNRRFVCDICHFRFRRQDNLTRHHQSLHTTDRPFECNVCNKRFSRNDNLSQHSRTH